MKVTTDKVIEAQEILIKGKDKCFSDSEWEWAINLLAEALRDGYAVIKVC